MMETGTLMSFRNQQTRIYTRRETVNILKIHTYTIQRKMIELPLKLTNYWCHFNIIINESFNLNFWFM